MGTNSLADVVRNVASQRKLGLLPRLEQIPSGERFDEIRSMVSELNKLQAKIDRIDRNIEDLRLELNRFERVAQ